MNDDTYTAVVDRFEGDLAVLLLEDDGETVAERVIETTRLPDDGRHVDAVLTVSVADDEVVDVTYEPDVTAERADAAQSRFDRLSRRPPSDDDQSDTDQAPD